MKIIYNILGFLALKTKSYSSLSACWVFGYEPDLPEEDTEGDIY